MTWTVTKRFCFEAAHSLPHLPPTHKCHHLHGHSYKVTVACQADYLTPNRYWVTDYAEIATVVEPLIEMVDHQNLNKVLKVPTTAENIARWFFEKLEHKLPHLAWVEVQETESASVIYSRNNSRNK